MTEFSRVVSPLIMGLMLVVTPMSDVHAAELNVLAGGSTTGWLTELAPQFERVSGHKLAIHFDSTPNLIKRAVSGVPLDVAVVPVDVFKDAAATARFVPGPTIDIARVGYGVIVRAGAPKPDISTPGALKQTLLEARSVAFLPESAAGAYVLKVFERLGVAEAMKAKTRAQTPTARIAEAVASGEAELGVFLVIDGPRGRTRGDIPTRTAAGPCFHRGGGDRQQGPGSRQELHQLSEVAGSHRGDQG